MSRGRNNVGVRVALCALLLLAFGSDLAVAQPAPDANSVLLLAKSVREPEFSLEASQAYALGYTIVIATDEQWSMMTYRDFASYRAVIIGDGMCTGRTSQGAAEATIGVWGPAVSGNVIVVGTHPAATGQTFLPAKDLVRNGIRFAASGPGTGAYITPGCFMSDAPLPIGVLQPFGSFKAARLGACPRETHLSTADPNLFDLTDPLLSGWPCTADMRFSEWPADFEVLAVATNAASAYVGPDGVPGAPFMLIRRPAFISSELAGGGELMSTQAETGLMRLDGSGMMSGMSGGMASASIPFDMYYKESIFYYDFEGSVLDTTVKGYIEAYASWAPQSSSSLAWNPDQMRQGEDPGLTNTLDPGAGTMKLAIGGGISFGDVGVDLEESIDGTCDLRLNDVGDYTCELPGGCFNIPGLCLDFLIGKVCLCLDVDVVANVSPDDFTEDRTLVYAGEPEPTGMLTFPPRTLDDSFKVSCYQPEGTEVIYQLANPATTPNVGFALSFGIGANACVCIPLVGCECESVEGFHIYTTPSLLEYDFALTGPNGEASLGTVLADNKAPDLSALATVYSGLEGSPIQFSGEGATDNCMETVTWTWKFSDHGVAYGFSPYHTFRDNAEFSGQVRATDLAGNSVARDLSISVGNVTPAVEAGPDMGSAWGVPVVFNGAAVDPGAADQPTLIYNWSFGDGTPSATGGPSVSHAYASPGTYLATLTVCDKDGACNTDTTSTTIRKRNTVVSYLGDQKGTYDMLTTLKASLTDEFGKPVQGRNVAFMVGTEGDAASTNTVGIASTSHLLALSAGAFSASANFPGDVLYFPASESTSAYTVAAKPTSLTYNGATSGGPNKIITLSATLVDSQGKALAGRTINFTLGAQSASATTNANGLATTTLKLAQKNGTYQLVSTFTPTGLDVGRYVASTVSKNFKLQAR